MTFLKNVKTSLFLPQQFPAVYKNQLFSYNLLTLEQQQGDFCFIKVNLFSEINV